MSRRRTHKVDQLRACLSTEDRAKFDEWCDSECPPTYERIREFFAERGHQVSINAIFHWWHANFPSQEETKFLRAIGAKEFKKNPNDKALQLADMASHVILEGFSKSDLSKVDFTQVVKSLLVLSREIKTSGMR
jgi:hypothetical protein